MIDPIETMMLKARVWLLMEQPFFGQVIMHLDMVDATDWCPTAAVDGRRFYYNREFIKSLTKENLIFLCGHEILHVIYDQIFRRGKRNAALWNMAADYLVNYELDRAKIGIMPTGGLLNPHYSDDFSTEELYDLLEQQQVTIQATLDMHLDGDETNDNDAEGSGPVKLTEAERQEIRDTMRGVIVQAAQNCAPGNLPLGVERLLNRLTKPRIDWRQWLSSILRSHIKHDYTYTRISRRSWSSGLILPGQDVMTRITATAWLDGSGSTSQEMVTDFLSEVKGIMATFQDFELTVGTFDTEPYNIQVFTPRNAGAIDKYQFIGGGGTMPSCCWEYMRENKMKPHQLLIFGDGEYGNDWGEKDYCDTLFIIHSNPSKIAPYGRTIQYDPKR